jgi:hypothetical protein
VIVGQNALLNQYVPTFYIKDIRNGQSVIYDSVRKAFVNSDVVGGSGATRLGELQDVSSNVDNPLSLQNGQALVYDAACHLWVNEFIDYNTLINKPTNGSYSFAGLSDTAKPSLPNGYVKWNSDGTQLIYSTTIPASSITGLAKVATTGDYNDLINKPTVGTGTVTSVDVSGGVTGLTTTGGPVTTSGVITLSGTLSALHGGTGANTYITGDMLYSSGTNTLSKRSIGTEGQVLTVSGGVPVWTTVTGTGSVTSVDVSGGTTGLTTTGGPVTSSGIITLGGTLAISNGGTGATTQTGAANAILPDQAGNVGKVLATDGTTVYWTTPSSGQTTTLTGDVTGSGTTTINTTLKTVNDTPGTYADAHFVPTITVNNKGLVTSITTQHVDTSARDIVVDQQTITIDARHQYIVTGTMEVDGRLENNGRLAIL